ncbi:MAG: homoserine kinase [Endomicrobium sp.]|jgi:homoserine kinase|uniref:homoserine kinase n=1 Tax=Candidatus Endomicrobiellum cubanum TaxID=3242325 RepID=UPI00282CC325|nr:homoserine kinase [Endomicrobium sp.]
MKVKVRVPSSTANLGPGFDVFGAALCLYNEFEAEYVPNAKKTKFVIHGEGKKFLAIGEKSLLWQSMQEAFKVLGTTKYSLNNLNIVINNNIPLSGGLGSSSTAIVGGIMLANALCSNKLDKSQIAELAIKIEGHPDNVVPAIFGGICICSKNEDEEHGTVVNLPIPKLKVVLCVPSFELRTKRSREILPKMIDMKDAVFNISRVALLTAAFCCADYSLLKQATQDRLHQPYRGKMIPTMNKVLQAALGAKSFGAFLSGSGPTLAAFCSKKDAVNVQNTMGNAWKKESVSVKSYILDFDVKGAMIV